MDEFDKIFSAEERRELKGFEQDFMYDVNHGIRYVGHVNYILVKDLLSAWMNSQLSDRLEKGEFTEDEEFVLSFLEEMLHTFYMKLNEDNPDVVEFDLPEDQ